jgi:hypothetical protein
MIIEPPSQEQVLANIRQGLMWLSRWKHKNDEIKGNFRGKYLAFTMKMVGEVAYYLEYWDYEDFLEWLSALDIDEGIKQSFYKHFKHEH